MRIDQSRTRLAAVGILIISILLMLIPARPVQAAAAEDTEPLDLHREGSLSIRFVDGQNGKPFSFGTKVGVFRTADISLENGLQFIYDELFESVGQPPTQNSQYNDRLADRLEEVALFKGISLEVPSQVIREDGTVNFTGLTPGLFLIFQMSRGTDSPRYQVRPFIVTLPVQDADGSFVYDVEMIYKSSDHGQGTASLIGEGQSMIDSSSVPAPKENKESRWPLLAACLAGGVVLGFLFTRLRR